MLGPEERELEAGKIDADVGDRWVLVRRVEEPMGVVFWPSGLFTTKRWAGILQT